MGVITSNQLLEVAKRYKINIDTLEKVEGVIKLDPSYFNDIKLTPENVAKISRDTLLELVEHLYENLPVSNFDKYEDKYEGDSSYEFKE